MRFRLVWIIIFVFFNYPTFNYRCLEARRDLACIWKLLGDACVLFSSLPDKYVRLKVPAKMMSEQRRVREGQKEVVLNKTEILILGSRSYYEALALNCDSSRLWYDLSICYNKMAMCSKSPEKKKEMRGLACAAVKKSLLVNENSWESWNLFGVISASPEIKDYPLAQHCFIRALDENDSSPIIWTNLGTLYLCLSDLKLANQSFAEAQRLDHDYVQCWIGQVLPRGVTGERCSLEKFPNIFLSGNDCASYGTSRRHGPVPTFKSIGNAPAGQSGLREYGLSNIARDEEQKR